MTAVHVAVRRSVEQTFNGVSKDLQKRQQDLSAAQAQVRAVEEDMQRQAQMLSGMRERFGQVSRLMERLWDEL